MLFDSERMFYVLTFRKKQFGNAVGNVLALSLSTWNDESKGIPFENSTEYDNVAMIFNVAFISILYIITDYLKRRKYCKIKMNW